MKVVSRFEANLLRILDLFLRRVPLEQALPLITARCPQPKCLSRTAVELVQDHLAKGCTLLLSRWGAWRKERFLRAGQVAEGRLWERSAPKDLGLAFSEFSLRFLIWITVNNPADEKPALNLPEKDLTPADHLLFYLAYGALREKEAAKEVAGALRSRRLVSGNVLCGLAFPEEVPGTSMDFAPWTSGLGSAILESLQLYLADRWVMIERTKGTIADWDTLTRQSRNQEQVLDIFLQAVEAANRPDLARFLLEAAGRVLTPDANARMWVSAQAGGGRRLADRVDTYRSALALLHRVDRFRQQALRARSVGYFDEDYSASQLVKAEWERCGGELLCMRAQAVIRELDPMVNA